MPRLLQCEQSADYPCLPTRSVVVGVGADAVAAMGDATPGAVPARGTIKPPSALTNLWVSGM